MTGENGYPETPDWRVDPHPSPFDPPTREDVDEPHLIRGTD